MRPPSKSSCTIDFGAARTKTRWANLHPHIAPSSPCWTPSRLLRETFPIDSARRDYHRGGLTSITENRIEQHPHRAHPGAQRGVQIASPGKLLHGFPQRVALRNPLARPALHHPDGVLHAAKQPGGMQQAAGLLRRQQSLSRSAAIRSGICNPDAGKPARTSSIPRMKSRS